MTQLLALISFEGDIRDRIACTFFFLIWPHQMSNWKLHAYNEQFQTTCFYPLDQKSQSHSAWSWQRASTFWKKVYIGFVFLPLTKISGVCYPNFYS